MGAYDYSTTANSNTSVGGVSIAEGMNPSAVNNAIRAALADTAKLLKDIGGANVSSGNDTITLTSSSTIAAYADGQPFLFIAGGTNTGAATLNIDSVGAKAVRKGADVALSAGDITANMPCLVVYDASANSAAGAWLLLNPYTGQQSFQPLDSDLTAIAALTTTSYGRALLTLDDAAALTAAADVVVGDSGSGGTKGLVPTPGAGDAAAGKFLKADGTFAVPGSTGLSASDQTAMEAASATDSAVTPGRQHFHPGHPKCAAKVTVSGGTPTLRTTTDYNITSITDSATGRLTITIDTDFSDAHWVCLATVETAVTTGLDAWNMTGVVVIDSGGQAAGSVILENYTDMDGAGGGGSQATEIALADPVAWHMIGIGDHA